MCAISGFLSRQIADFPLLLDELIDAKAFDELPSRAGFSWNLAARTERLSADDPERQVEALRQFQKVAVFTVALADLTGRLPLMRVSDRLTDIAELIVAMLHGSCLAANDANLRNAVLRREEATSAPGRPWPSRVTASSADLELGYASDLDLVFLHDSAGSIQLTDGDAAARQRHVLLALGAAHRALAHHAFRGRPPL